MPRILVIDDDATNLRISRSQSRNGWVWCHHQTEDGIKGQAMALQKQPDLIMLDLMLPRVDGFCVCQRPLRRDQRLLKFYINVDGKTQNKVENFNAES